MARIGLGLIAAIFTLAACQQAGGPASVDNSTSSLEPADTLNLENDDALIAGHRLMDVGNFDLALKAYLRAAGTLGMTPDVLSALGTANLRLGRLGQAETLLRRAVESDPEFVPAWNNLGVVLMERGKHAEAMQVFHRAFALDSGESDHIRENLRIAIEKTENPFYDSGSITNHEYALVRQGSSQYLISPTP